MTLYALLDIGSGLIAEYPYDINKLRQTCSFRPDPSPVFLVGHGVVVVHPTPRPKTDCTWSVAESAPQPVLGKWIQTWDVEPATDAEIAERTAAQAAAVKTKRNRLLQESDWTQLPDAPADRQAWATYREQLRQVKNQPGFPWDVRWPLSPDESAELVVVRPPAEVVGQEWTDGSGQLWRVVQARDETSGQFVADDPATPQRESLQWQPVL